MPLFYSQEQYNEYMDELHGPRATPSAARNEYACNAGEDDPDRAWILTPWDTWESNPFYHGPAAPHPEYEGDYE